jgi:predicted DNA-binding transcriptional regulator AlpA
MNASTAMSLTLSDCPAWPRFLTRETAALYVGVSPATWDKEVKAGFWPQPLRRGAEGGKLTWDRAVIDAWADRVSGLAEQRATTVVGGPVPADHPAPALDAAEVERRLNAAFGAPKNRPQRRSQASR